MNSINEHWKQFSSEWVKDHRDFEDEWTTPCSTISCFWLIGVGVKKSVNKIRFMWERKKTRHVITLQWMIGWLVTPNSSIFNNYGLYKNRTSSSPFVFDSNHFWFERVRYSSFETLPLFEIAALAMWHHSNRHTSLILYLSNATIIPFWFVPRSKLKNKTQIAFVTSQIDVNEERQWQWQYCPNDCNHRLMSSKFNLISHFGQYPMYDWLFTNTKKPPKKNTHARSHSSWHSNTFKQANEYFNKLLIRSKGEQWSRMKNNNYTVLRKTENWHFWTVVKLNKLLCRILTDQTWHIWVNGHVHMNIWLSTKVTRIRQWQAAQYTYRVFVLSPILK